MKYNTQLSGSDWATATHGVAGVSIDDTHVPEVGFRTVEVSIPKSLAPHGKLFARLSVVNAP